MKKFLLFVALAIAILTKVHAQSNIFNPADPDNVFTATNHPAAPPYGPIAKWGHTQSLTWGGTGTTSYKAYYYKGMPFRVKFPKSYQHNVADGKKYPILIFFHGAGESGDLYDNEYQMYHGGSIFRDWVDNGNFDGFVFFEQSSTGFHSNYFGLITNMIDSLTKYCKVDADRVLVNGLSSGGQGTWEFLAAYPQYIAGGLPISAARTEYIAPMPGYIHIPMWLFNGGQDTNPDPSTAQMLVDSFTNKGGNIKHTLYPDFGHGVWDVAWADPGFVPFLNAAHKANPLVYFGRTDFCVGDAISVKLGLTAGFYAYEWQKDNVTITGATANTVTLTQLGTYRARFKRTATSAFSDWSPAPVVIKYKATTQTPAIAINGLKSKVLPAPDNSTTVPLIEPDGYISYKWVHLPDSVIVGTQSTFNAPVGQYTARVTELYGCSAQYSPSFSVINAAGANSPDPAKNLIANSTSKTTLSLSWTEVANPVNNETGFEIYRAAKTGGPYTLIAINPANNTSYLDQGLVTNTSYFYIVRPVNNNGAAIVTNEATAKTQVDQNPPTAPSALAVFITTRTSVSLQWNASMDDVGVTQYDIYINGSKAYTSTTNSYTVYNLTYKQTYNFTVKARDAAGNVSPFSNQVSATAILQGLGYTYYEQSFDALPDFSTLTPAKKGVSANVDIGIRNIDVNYAVLWQGFIKIPVSGTYTFETNSDDGSKLYIGSYSSSATALVNNDGLHAAQSVSGSQYLTAGVYPITVSFFQKSGGQTMEVYWASTTGIARQRIPDNAFKDDPVGLNTDTISGLSYSYYEGNWSVLPDFNALTPVKKGQGANVDIGVRKRDTTYGILWQGYINIPKDGTYTFETNSDDGSKLYIGTYNYSATALVNNDGLHAGQVVTGSIFLSAGRYPFATTFFQNGGGQVMDIYWSSNTGIARQKIPDNAFFAVTSVKKDSLAGLNYSYYEGTWNVLPDFTSMAPLKKGVINNVDIAVRSRDVNYGVQWQGYISIPKSGNYTFETNSDDGSNLYIGSSSSPLVNNDGLHGPAIVTGTMFMSAGNYPITINFFQNSGGQTMEVYWSSTTGIARTRIPDSVFRISAPPAAPDSLTRLAYKYYEGTWSQMPDFNALTPVKTGTSANVDLAVRNRDVNYGLLWQGYINVPKAGNYTFETNSDDGSKLYIGNYNNASTALVNNDGLHAPQLVTGKMFLSAGINPIAITFFQNSGGQTMELYWSSDVGLARQRIPDSAFAVNIQTKTTSISTASVYVNFGDTSVAPVPWNNMLGYPFAGTVLANLKDDKGAGTGISLTYVDGWLGAGDLGMRPGNNSGIYPDAVVRSSIYEQSSTPKHIKLTGLNRAKLYNIVVFGGVNAGFNASSTYTVGSQAVSLNATYNSTRAAELNALKPDSTGTILLTITKDSTATYGYLNALVLQYYDSSLASGVLGPNNLIVEPLASSRNQLSLVWSDRSNNETAMEVWRATASAGTYTRVASLPANSTSYTDQGLTSDTRYFYKIKAVISGVAQSDFSNVATAVSPGLIVLVNLTWKYPTTILPWNNTATNPQINDRYGNLIDDQLNNTGLALNVVKNFNGEYAGGMNSGNNSYLFPDNVMISNYWVDKGQVATLKLDGLDQTKKYRIGFEGSATWSGDMTATMTINGKVGYLNTYLNTSKAVYLDSLTANGNGEILIDFSATGTYGFIGSVIIQAYTDNGFSGPTTIVQLGDNGTPTMHTMAGTLSMTDEIRNLKAYPNPIDQSFNLSFDPIKTGKKVKVEVYSISGAGIFSREFDLAAGSEKVLVNLPGGLLAPGMYMARISENGRLTKVISLLKLMK